MRRGFVFVYVGLREIHSHTGPLLGPHTPGQRCGRVSPRPVTVFPTRIRLYCMACHASSAQVLMASAPGPFCRKQWIWLLGGRCDQWGALSWSGEELGSTEPSSNRSCSRHLVAYNTRLARRTTAVKQGINTLEQVFCNSSMFLRILKRPVYCSIVQ